MNTEREWESLSLDEKLTELGFPCGPGVGDNDFRLTSDQRARFNAALDQLLDAGGLLGEIEAMAQAVTISDNPTEAVAVCTDIYKLITADE